jgi:TBC1 domain family member 5
VTDAVFLKKNPTLDAAYRLILIYTNRTPSAPKKHSARPSPSRQGQLTPRQSRPMSPSHRQVIYPGPSSLEIFLQGAAKTVKSRGEKWGVNKALRDAVDDVVKNVQGFQSGRSTPHSRGGSIFGQGGLKPGDAVKQVAALEDRNKSLAKMLEGAISELWGHQESLVETGSSDGVADGLSTAIAKVHLVQVYLENSSLPLPLDENQSGQEDQAIAQSIQSEKTLVESSEKSETTEQSEKTGEAVKGEPSYGAAQKGIPERALGSPLRRGGRGSDTSLQTRLPQSGQKSSLMEPSPSEAEPENPEIPSSKEKRPAMPQNNVSLTRPRQTLAQSSFSWMLEPGETRSNSTGEGVRHEKRRAGKGFLFGESDEEDEGGEEKKILGRTKGKKAEEAKKLDEVFHMGDLGSSDPRT